jgi:Transposase zinc-binding domain
MSRPRFEVADIIRSAGADFIALNCLWLRWTHIKVLRAIARCRTAALGGHIDKCTSCGHRATISYVTCRNRHCPKCQTGARERWIAARRQRRGVCLYDTAVAAHRCGTEAVADTLSFGAGDSLEYWEHGDHHGQSTEHADRLGLPHRIHGFSAPSWSSRAGWPGDQLACAPHDVR